MYCKERDKSYKILISYAWRKIISTLVVVSNSLFTLNIFGPKVSLKFLLTKLFSRDIDQNGVLKPLSRLPTLYFDQNVQFLPLCSKHLFQKCQTCHHMYLT